MTDTPNSHKPGGLQSWSIGPTFPWTVVGVTNAESRAKARRLGHDEETVHWQPWNTLTDERGPLFILGELADRWIAERLGNDKREEPARGHARHHGGEV